MEYLPHNYTDITTLLHVPLDSCRYNKLSHVHRVLKVQLLLGVYVHVHRVLEGRY